ncbi:MAG: DUF1659 domain-containing protein [Acidaminococcaceae bacterium]|nr:DUF1659 domain-containing protein [Acidaminococcaceae bacterium]
MPTTTKTATSYKLSLAVENGVNTLGAVQVKSVSIGSVKLDAEDDKCLAVANALSELMSHEVVNVYVTEKAELASAE